MKEINGLEEMAPGVYRFQGDLKKGMNIYLIEGPDGEIIQFDAGTRPMTKLNRRVAQEVGGIDKVVLGHAHADHRGTASKLGPPVYCHPDEVKDAESTKAIPDYMDLGLVEFKPVRWLYPVLLRYWDGGAVEIAGTIEEGEEIAGFKVVHFPGHAPGMIGLWRESDRVAIVSDTIYVIDSAHMKELPPGEASVPHPAFAWNHQTAKESVLKLAALKPRVVMAGHGEPLREDDLTATLEAAAAKY